MLKTNSQVKGFAITLAWPDNARKQAGSWFHLFVEQEGLLINRYSDKGKSERSGVFQLVKEKGFSEKKPFEFIHLSHCQSVRIR